MVIKFKSVTFENSYIDCSFEINGLEITSFINCNIEEIFNSKIIGGEIKFGRFVINSKSDKRKTKKIRDMIYFCSNELNELSSINIMNDITSKVKSIKGNRLYELFKVFNLNKDILEKSFVDISQSEKKKILLICGIMSNSDVIIFDNPSYYLDNKSKDNLIKELKRLKRDKTIIISSNDTEFLLKISDKVFILDNKKIIGGNKYEILSQEELLSINSVKVPDIISFVNKVYYTKKVKLGYRDNINDTIKDIYRNV